MLVLILDFVLLKWDKTHTNRDYSILKILPSPDNIYAVGNSMFYTGIDFHLLNSLLPENEHVDFEYHNGYYSNLWYLLFKTTIIPSKRYPKFVIWGFRPSYAKYPAFRQKKIGDIEKINTKDDPYYELKISYQDIPVKDMSAKDKFQLWIEKNSFIYGKRKKTRAKLTSVINKIAILALKPIISEARLKGIKKHFISKKLSVADFLIQKSSKKRFAMVEETVADQGKRFIKGRKVPFDESFIPDIASMLSSAEIPSLVLIFKPSKTVPEDIRFADDAEKFFISNKISYINFLNDDRITGDLYAKGDHYNTEGRKLITNIVSQKLIQLLRDSQMSILNGI